MLTNLPSHTALTATTLDTYRGLGYAQFGWSIFLNRRLKLEYSDKGKLRARIVGDV